MAEAELKFGRFVTGGEIYRGTATLATASTDPDLGTITVKTGMNTVFGATATYAEDPGTSAPIYYTQSGGDVTFYAGNANDIDIYYSIHGLI